MSYALDYALSRLADNLSDLVKLVIKRLEDGKV